MNMEDISVGDKFNYINVQGRVYPIEVIEKTMNSDTFFRAIVIDGEHQGELFHANINRTFSRNDVQWFDSDMVI